MLIVKDNLPLVAMDFMNNTHFEDVDIINELYENILNYEKEENSLNYEKLDSKYKEWLIHTENHFKTEEEKMRNKGFFAMLFIKMNMILIYMKLIIFGKSLKIIKI